LENRTLADTTVWIEFFRGKSKVADLIEMLLTENAVCTCGVVMFELLQGIKSEGEKNKILSILATLPYFEMTQQLWRSAAEVSLSLKKHGVSLPLSDIFIATIAVENDLSIYTLDNHFTQIPNLKLHSF